jgi:Ca2+-binding RTX toxin-like protein
MAKKKSTDIAAGVNTTANMQIIGGPGTFSGQLEKVGDHDWIRVNLVLGNVYDFFLCLANPGETNGDAEFSIRDVAGNELVAATATDDGGTGTNSYFKFTATYTGVFYIDVGEHNNDRTGEYSLAFAQSLPTIGTTELSAGVDVYEDVIGDEVILGGAGSDGIEGGIANRILGEQGDDVLKGGVSADFLWGGIGNDTIDGDDGDDWLMGDAGADHLFGDVGADRLYGGAGKDELDGGIDADTFYYTALSDSRRGALRDVIRNFSAADEINLSAIDARKGGAADDDFTFIGAAKFHDKKGELHYVKVDRAGTLNDVTLVQGDVNGDGKADIEIELKGLLTLSGGNFDL